MTKAEETLEHMSVNSPVRELVLNGNINAICLSAMEEQSIKFAEWCEENYWVKVKGIAMWYNTEENIADKTTSELYKLFNEL